MSKNSLALVACLLVTLARADLPFYIEKELQEFEHSVLSKNLDLNRADTVYRLPETVVPLEYDIDIDLNFAATTDRAEYTYDGKVTIVVQPTVDNVTQIVLHANVDSITSVSLLTSSNAPVNLNPQEPVTLEPTYHFLIINLAQTLELGANYTLTIGYSSTMNQGPLKRGIFRGFYTDNDGTTRIYATTHFQPYNARQAFPCWDEPLYKAAFTLHLTRPAAYSAVFTNTRLDTSETLTNGRVKDTFLQTPVMSSYLVTFLVSESFTVLAQDTTINPPIRIIGRPNGESAELVLDYAMRMTRYFDEYLNITYESQHPNLSNDHVASPDWASAGTENWGMVSYRELYMFMSSQETTMAIEHYAATLLSHEIAHMWFGNLITCYWWSNTWINEGFASYFGYIATEQMFPEYEHEDHFNSRYLQTSLSYDASASSEALNHDVNTPLQVTGHFGTISYSKGASFLRMISDMITPDTFRKALYYFLSDKAYQPAYPEDLYSAFERAITEDNSLADYQNFNFADYYNSWVNEPGYPLLTVDVDYTTGEMRLSQSRYFSSATATPTGQIYQIPITYASASNPDFSIRPTYMMTGETGVLIKDVGEEWVIFNNLQRGHYRVTYNDRNWQLITQALLENPESINFANRAQIVDDVFAFMRAGYMTHSYGFDILRFLRTEENYHVWEPAISSYSWLRNRLRHLPEEHAEFDEFILSYMEHAIETVGYDVGDSEAPTISQMRQAVLHFACLLNHQQCVEESTARFAQLRNGQWIDPRIRRNVYVVGIREGNTTDFDFLLNRFRTSNYANDQLEMLRALAATRNPDDLYRFLDLTLTDEVRQHDKTTAFGYALLGVADNAPYVLDWLMNNIDRLREEYVHDAPNRPVHTVLSNMAAYLDEANLIVYQNWLVTTQASSAEYSTAISAITSARNNMAWGTTNAPDIIGATKAGAAAITASIAMIAAVTIFAVAA